MLLKNLIFASFVVACLSEICPMQNHTVCNEDIDEDHACVCAMGGAEVSNHKNRKRNHFIAKIGLFIGPATREIVQSFAQR